VCEGPCRVATRYIHDARTLVRRTDTCLVLLGPGHTTPLQLRGTAIAIWDAFESPRLVDDVAAALAVQYGVSITGVRDDVRSVVKMLRDREMLSRAPRRDER
jgi:hypothetical protein